MSININIKFILEKRNQKKLDEMYSKNIYSVKYNFFDKKWSKY